MNRGCKHNQQLASSVPEINESFSWKWRLRVRACDMTISVLRYSQVRSFHACTSRRNIESIGINQKIIVSSEENEKLFRRTTYMHRSHCDSARRMNATHVSRAMCPTKIPTVLIFQWTVFHRRWVLGGGPRGAERKRSARFALSSAVPCSSRPLRAGKPHRTMCTELLLIKGIVERLVERPRREPTAQSMKLHLAVWTATRKGASAQDTSCSLFCGSWHGHVNLTQSRFGGPADRERHWSYAESRISISQMEARHSARRNICLWDVCLFYMYTIAPCWC